MILNEPTNYLVREGLGVLILAIKDCKGGVLIISHNKEFGDGVATEKWIMYKGMLRIEGESVAKEEEKQAGNKQQEDVFDVAGNKIDVKKVAALCDKDKKKAIKDLQKKLKEDKKKKMSDEEMWEMEDKLNELKESLGNEPGVVLLTHPLPEQGFGKSSRALEIVCLYDVDVVLLTHPLPEQGFGKSSRAHEIVCLHDLDGKNFGQTTQNSRIHGSTRLPHFDVP